jgi:hypothetical protein
MEQVDRLRLTPHEPALHSTIPEFATRLPGREVVRPTVRDISAQPDRRTDNLRQGFPFTIAKSITPEYDQFTHSLDIGDRFRIGFFDYLPSIHHE